MSHSSTVRTPQQQLALEKKLGLGLLATLLTIFCFVLSLRLGHVSWNSKKIDINFGSPTDSSSVAGLTPDHSGEAHAPPVVYLPPAPAIAARPPALPQPVAAAPQPPANNAPPLTGNRYAAAPPTIVTPPTTPTPPQIVSPPPVAVAAAAPPVREPGVAAIGLVAGNMPAVKSGAIPASATLPIATPNKSSSHVFAEGDNFWSVAQKAYGDGAYYRALFAYNQDRYPHMEDVRPGDRIDLPSAAELQRQFPQLCSPAVSAVRPQSLSHSGRTYVVQAGDTLFEIARRELGQASRWAEIYNLNRATLGENLQQLQPGTRLTMPEAASR